MDSSGFVSAEQGVERTGNQSTHKVIADNNRKKSNVTTSTNAAANGSMNGSVNEKKLQPRLPEQVMARLSDKVQNIISRIDVSTARESDFSRVMNSVAETRPERLAAIMEKVEQLAARGAVSEGFIDASANVLDSSGDDALGDFIRVAGDIVSSNENPESFYSFISKVAEKVPADLANRITQADNLVSNDEAAAKFRDTATEIANEIRESLDSRQPRQESAEKYSDEDQGIATEFPFNKGFFSIYYKYLMDILEGNRVDGAEIANAFKERLDEVAAVAAPEQAPDPVNQALSKSIDTTV